MMLSLGQFVFGIDTLAYQQLQRASEWRHAENARVGARSASQFVGPGADTITLDGVLLPELTGQRASLDTLRDMGGEGAAWSLVDGEGVVYGAYVITALTETGEIFTREGTARRIAFNLSLRRVDDAAVADNPRAAAAP